MELRQLVYFATVARLRNFTQAAEELYVSQPGISSAVRKLEAELGVTLLDRSGGKVRLTQAGECFRDHVQGILAAVDDATAEMHAIGTAQREPVHVGLPPMLGAHVLIPLLSCFRSSDSAVDLHVHELGSREIVRALRERKLDVGLVIPAAADTAVEGCLEELTFSATQEFTVMVGMAPDHPLTELSVVSVQDLEDEPLVLVPPEAQIRNIVLDAFTAAGVTPAVVHTSTQIESVRRLVHAGVGVSFFPATIRDVLGDLAYRPLAPTATIACAVVHRTSRPVTRGFDAVVRFLTERPLPAESLVQQTTAHDGISETPQ